MVESNPTAQLGATNRMEPSRQLAPSLIGRGTVATWRDMLRALETIENLAYRYVVAGQPICEGNGALVKLMADPDSATMIVNGCLFLNVGSFRYLDFEQNDDDAWVFTLVGDGSVLELVALPESEEPAERTHALLEDTDPDLERIVALDEDDDSDD